MGETGIFMRPTGQTGPVQCGQIDFAFCNNAFQFRVIQNEQRSQSGLLRVSAITYLCAGVRLFAFHERVIGG